MDRGRRQGFAIAVVGGGVVGCALLREFALAGCEPLLLERGGDILSGASKANSAILHTGYDAEPGTLEAELVRRGRQRYLELAPRFGLPVEKTGGLVVAWQDGERPRLDTVLATAQRNGIRELELLDRDALLACEPQLAGTAVAAARVPGEYVVDPWTTPLAYALQAIQHGAEVRRGTEVLEIVRNGSRWRLVTTRGPVEAEIVVNAAGLFADRIEAMTGRPGFRILPRKGQFLVYDKPARRLLNAILYPLPRPRSKGVLLTPTVFGNLLVGPTSEPVEDRADTSTDAAVLRGLREIAATRLPALRRQRVVAAYAGLRPATERGDYVIAADPSRRWITVAGIRSTGLTAALGIAEHVRELFERHFGALAPARPRHWPELPHLAEREPRPYTLGGNGEIVCFCELVTRREVEAALSGPLPARDLGALKRRTRCTMGRCQGFYCGWRLARFLDTALADGRAAS